MLCNSQVSGWVLVIFAEWIFNAVLAKNGSSRKELLVGEAAAGHGPEKPALTPKASSRSQARMAGSYQSVGLLQNS